MPVNDIISQAEYNNIRNKVVNVLGTGASSSGYGQPLSSAAVALGNRVTITQWANLRYDIINAWVHQTGSAPTSVTVLEGNTIRFNAIDAPVSSYGTLADSIVANRFTVGVGQSAVAIPAGGPASRTYTGIGADFWTSSISCTLGINFANSNQARYFFNSGGQIRITSTRSGGNLGTSQNTNWTTILNNAGQRSYGGSSWYSLNSGFTQYYSLAGSGAYGSNNYALQARVTDVGDNSSGTAASAQIRVVFTDAYTDPGPPAPGDAVDGTFSITVSLVYATGLLVPAGNFTVVQPTISFGAIG